MANVEAVKPKTEIWWMDTITPSCAVKKGDVPLFFPPELQCV